MKEEFNTELKGSVKALLDEYKRAIDELIRVIKPVNGKDLNIIIDPETDDADCRSIQTILTHIVHSGYGYTIYMGNAIENNRIRPEKEKLNNVDQYIIQLKTMFSYFESFFKDNPALEIQQTDSARKITVNWGQQYDIEQMMEHAIVHILRHRRQIERFIAILSDR